jgi:peptidoglycan/LPS O-acetylase OafA/YrhL
VTAAPPQIPPDVTPVPTEPTAQSVSHAPVRENVRGGALDFLRFLASLLIVVYHYGAESPMRIERFAQVFSRGFLATDFFLILSGYVLGRAYGASTLSGRLSTPQFWVRRAARVWPGHLAVLAMLVVLVLVLNAIGTDAHKPSRFAWDQLAPQALLVHAWGFPSDGWNLPSWSLSALIVCYALFPSFWRAVSKIRHAWLLPLLGLAILAAFEVLAETVFDQGLADLRFQFGVIRALPLFILGVCLARTVDMRWPSEKAAHALLWGGVALLVITQPLDRYALPDPLLFDAPSLLAIAMIVLGAGRLPVKRPRQWIEEGAKLSFALFITHIFVGVIYWSAVHKLIDTVPIGIGWQWLMWLAGFPIAYGAAWLFHRYVDQPLQDRIQPLLRRTS